MSWRAVGKTNAQIFDEIYIQKKWRDDSSNEADVFSGSGSLPRNSSEYEQLVIDYIKKKAVKTILDVGCGDFQVSSRILSKIPDTTQYVGIDVSKVVIDRNNKLHAAKNVQFRQLDASLEAIPVVDLVLVREVLQHLPNSAVKSILLKVRNSRFALITNTVATNPIRINADIAAGSASRAALGSGLWLDKAPFNFPGHELLRVKHASKPTEIVVFEMASNPKN